MDRKSPMFRYNLFIGILGIIILTLLIVCFTIVGVPISQEAKDLDQIRLSNFSSLKYQIDNYYQNNKRLPINLSVLNLSTDYKDPKTKAQYNYKILSSYTYELCAEFSTDTKNQKSSLLFIPKVYALPVIPVDQPSYSSDAHKKGYDCIQYRISDNVLNRTYYNPTPTPRPSSFKITYPSAQQILCTGIPYVISWEVPTDITTVTLSLASDSSSKNSQYTIGDFPSYSQRRGGSIKGSTSWEVPETINGVRIIENTGYLLKMDAENTTKNTQLSYAHQIYIRKCDSIMSPGAPYLPPPTLMPY